MINGYLIYIDIIYLSRKPPAPYNLLSCNICTCGCSLPWHLWALVFDVVPFKGNCAAASSADLGQVNRYLWCYGLGSIAHGKSAPAAFQKFFATIEALLMSRRITGSTRSQAALWLEVVLRLRIIEV